MKIYERDGQPRIIFYVGFRLILYACASWRANVVKRDRGIRSKVAFVAMTMSSQRDLSYV